MLLVGLGVTGAAVVAFLLWRNMDVGVETGPSANLAEAFAGGPTRLVYADFDDGKDLLAIDLDSGETTELGELPHSGDTHAAPGSSWVSIVSPEEFDGEFRPVLYVFDVENERTESLGIADDPEWSRDGSQLAYLKPVDESQCRDDECGGALIPVVVDMETLEETELTEAGRHDIRAWAGDYLLLENEDQVGAPVLRSVSLSGEVHDLPLDAIDLWGASPDGRFLVESGDQGTRFHTFVDGRIEGSGPEIGIPEDTKLGGGSFSHDSGTVAALALGESNELEMFAFSPLDPEPRSLTTGGEVSTTDVLWSPDNDAFSFSRFDGSELEAVHCELDGDCEELFSWTRGIALLRVE